jgi:hypothetical protein
MARKPKLVKFEDGIHWLVIKLAAEKSGLTKPELARRALAGDLRFLPDSYGLPEWFAEPDIDPLRKALLEKETARKGKPPRKKSLKQLEREWADKPENKAITNRETKVPESRRGNKPMIWKMLSKPKMSKPD